MLVSGGIRTQAVLMTSPPLYQLSYPDSRLPRVMFRAGKRQNYIFFGVFMPKYHQIRLFSTFRGQKIRPPAFYH